MKNTLLFIIADTNLTGSTISLYKILKFSNICEDYDVTILAKSSSGQSLHLLKELNCKLFYIPKSTPKKNLIYKLFHRILYCMKVLFLYYKIKPSIIYSNTIMNTEEIVLGYFFTHNIIVHVHEAITMIKKKHLGLRFLNLLTKEYIAASPYSRQSLIEVLSTKKQINIVPNGIDINKSVCKHFSTNTTMLSIVGTIDTNKSQLDGIKAVHYLNGLDSQHKYYLNLVGKVTDDHYYNLLVDYIELNHLWDYVFFKGEIFNQDEIYSNTDLVIIPSKEESFSMVIIEAFSLKIPVISTKTGGAIGLITDGATGFLYEYNDIDHLTHLIVDLTENRNKITSVTDRAYEYVSQNYDIRITSKLIENLLAKL